MQYQWNNLWTHAYTYYVHIIYVIKHAYTIQNLAVIDLLWKCIFLSLRISFVSKTILFCIQTLKYREHFILWLYHA